MDEDQRAPREIVAAIEATGSKRTTPCGTGNVEWRLFGRGAPVVFLHGGMGSWMHWIRNVPGLRRHLAMLVPDIPGHMDSALPPGPYAPDAVADVLLQGIDSILGSRSSRFAIVGFSFGSVIAGHVASRAGARVDHLVLVSMSGTGLPRGQTEPLRKWRQLATAEEREAAHRHNLKVSMLRDCRPIDDLAVFIHGQSTERAQPVSAPISLGTTLRDCLPHVKARVAGIWGAHDPASAPFMAERVEFLHSAHPNAPVIVIEDASHWVAYEACERFDRELLALIRPGAGREALPQS